MITDTKATTLTKLYQAGQSPWYDNIERGILEDGSFDKLIESGIRGVTTNPAIFEKAINSSGVYDESIREFSRKKMSPEEIFDELIASDIRSACNKLKDIYASSNGLDGYVSVEVLPEYAHNTKKTIDYAKNILKKISKPNVMIKVPGTKKGCEAVRELIASGVNVNVTLLFSQDHYEDAAYAYIDGIRMRLKRDIPVFNVVSVASLFISRIDTKVDALLKDFLIKKINSKDIVLAKSLLGKAAVSNSKIIYESYKNLFLLKAFEALKKSGAKIQRVLWASTGTKNPLYSDVKYVEELIGQYTINTMPHVTMDAFLDHGIVRSFIERDIAKAREMILSFKKLNIDVDDICNDLQIEGIEAFQKSFSNLIESIRKKS